MSRPIKFRVYEKSTKVMRDSVLSIHWLYGEDLHEVQVDTDIGPHLFNHPDEIILMQFTGLLDKNGVEIWEGDILSPGYTDDELFVVVFDESKARFAEKRVSKEYPTDAGFIMDGSFLRSTLSFQRIEVIGNIHQHPHLLEK